MLRLSFLVLSAIVVVVSGSVPHGHLSNASAKPPKKLIPSGTVNPVVPLKPKPKVNRFLIAHNAVREHLGEPPLTWDNGLARYARRFAETRVADCKMLHSDGEYGENIFWGKTSRWTPEKIVGVWVDEAIYYDPSTNSCTEGQMCGHYTQVVWRDSLRCGCARVECAGGAGIYAICVYDPPGNYIGEDPFQHFTY
ncbi:hypothetical protein MLD38_038337 [Melastoma candidum]|uniref:Uncharacterized protein n=1 Tax=Melastoma candidum TaxID=119954 RepID=A0ACB9KZ71_9MYRT|nr:hypothetical protein MLD38_038337 [Melastoma candidum]